MLIENERILNNSSRHPSDHVKTTKTRRFHVVTPLPQGSVLEGFDFFLNIGLYIAIDLVSKSRRVLWFVTHYNHIHFDILLI